MLQIIKKLSSQSADILGISASLLCMIHCLAFPVMISLGYIFKFSDDHDHVHEHWHWMDYFFVILAIWAVYNAAKNTHSKRIKIALWIGVLFFSIAILLHDLNPFMIVISIVASLALLIIHIINWKYHKNCKIVGE
ncbi:MerC domain-containing protein [Aquiflexum lacus]|uniref:MerC domain-containing protein n=1 Tax=Aquiflexum lacus TaxID=2483805 RepID=UPI00189472FE|nr:MerC domain-containing protein [Aquiflexum lacus]